MEKSNPNHCKVKIIGTIKAENALMMVCALSYMHFIQLIKLPQGLGNMKDKIKVNVQRQTFIIVFTSMHYHQNINIYLRGK